jgi:hypothetical protein
MPETNLFLMFTQRLNMLGVTYMVSGSVAVIIYGEPRLTHDVDLTRRTESSRNCSSDNNQRGTGRAKPFGPFVCQSVFGYWRHGWWRY